MTNDLDLRGSIFAVLEAIFFSQGRLGIVADTMKDPRTPGNTVEPLVSLNL